MPTIAILAIAAFALTLTAPSANKSKPQPTDAPPLRDDDPTDLLARALDAYIKGKEK